MLKQFGQILPFECYGAYNIVRPAQEIPCRKLIRKLKVNYKLMVESLEFALFWSTAGVTPPNFRVGCKISIQY